MPLFSIIVPVYNAEKTIENCLRSISVQSECSFEVLMIENGSRDSSREICSDFAGMDPRFRLIACDENKGPSGARNIGLENAKGEWIAFVDSDDFVEPNYLEVLRNGFHDADAVFFGYRQITVDGDFLGEHLPEIPENMDYHETLLQLHRQNLFGYTWIKAFRADVIGEHRFSKELNLLEDEVFACEVLTRESRVAVLPKAIYNYVSGNPGSLMGRSYDDYCRKVDQAYKAWKRLLKGCADEKQTLEAMANGHVNRCMYYAYERNINVPAFCGHLVQCDFFNDSTVRSRFAEGVRQGRYEKILRERSLYQLKIRMVRLLKR